MNWLSQLHGWRSLEVGWALTASPRLLGLLRQRAPFVKWFVSPITATACLVVAAIGAAVLRWLLGKWRIADTSTPAQITTLACSVLTGYAAGRWLPCSPGVFHTRGALLEDGLRRRAKARLVIITSPTSRVLPDDETKHFKFIVAPGSCKSTAIREVLEGALKRSDRA